MKLRTALLSPFWVMFLLLVCILTSFSFAYKQLKQEIQVTNRTRASLAELETMAGGISAQREALETRHGMPARPLEEVIGEDLLSKVDHEDADPVLLSNGMSLRTARLRFKHLRWDQIRDLMSRLETGTPPWRIEALTIEAGTTDLSGSLDVVVLDRAPAE